MCVNIYKYLKLVEYTSIPLTIAISLYIISGYGMISPIPSVIGFTYWVSYRIHTLPLLRYTTVLLIVIHAYAGITVVINRSKYLQRHIIIRKVLSLINLIYAAIVISVTTLAEIYIALRILR